jgi:hypothetical protein
MDDPFIETFDISFFFDDKVYSSVMEQKIKGKEHYQQKLIDEEKERQLNLAKIKKQAEDEALLNERALYEKLKTKFET